MKVLSLTKTKDLNKKNLDLLNEMLKDNVIIFIYGKNCPHCVTFKPEWTKYKKKSNISIIEIESVVITEIYNNHKKIFKKITMKDGPVYFPMIILLNVKNTKTKKYLYEGGRKSSAIKYIDENVSKNINVDNLNSSLNSIINSIILDKKVNYFYK